MTFCLDTIVLKPEDGTKIKNAIIMESELYFRNIKNLTLHRIAYFCIAIIPLRSRADVVWEQRLLQMRIGSVTHWVECPFWKMAMSVCTNLARLWNTCWSGTKTGG